VNVLTDREAGVIPYSGSRKTLIPNTHFLSGANHARADSGNFGVRLRAEYAARGLPATRSRALFVRTAIITPVADGLFRCRPMRSLT